MRPPADVQFDLTAHDYARHRQGFPPAFFDRLQGWGIGRPGQRILDLGTGTGALARGFAARGAEVTGLDPAPALLAETARLATESALRITWVEGVAESTGLPEGAYEVVSVGQAWHWFDRPRAAEEILRVLVPGGWVVLGHFDWIPLPGNLAYATERLIEAHNPAWTLGGGNGIHAEELDDLGIAGFTDLELLAFDVPTVYTPEDWRGRIRASAGIAASLSQSQVQAFDGELAALLARDFPGESLVIPHRVSAVLGRAPK